MNIQYVLSDVGDQHQHLRKPPKMIVVHSMFEFFIVEGKMTRAPDFLTGIGFSAHAFVLPGGKIIRQRNDDQFAYHAKGFNADSLGVEICVAGMGTYEQFCATIAEPWVEAEAFNATVALVRHWMREHGITEVKRHSDIDPTRKPDPGKGFPWDEFLYRVRYQHGTL